MYEKGDAKKTQASLNKTSAAQLERRGGVRHTFIAPAEVTETASGSCYSARATDLSSGGCFIDTLVPFTAGSKVRVVIREAQTQLEATGVVVYSQSGLGMGIAFDELGAQQRHALAVWIGEEAGQQQPKASEPQNPVSPSRSDHEALLRLVKLMKEKGILSESDAASIFNDAFLF